MTREEAINTLRANVMVACDTSDKVGYGTPLNKAIEQALDMAIKSLETMEEFEKAQILVGGRLNGRTYAYKCGLEDGKCKALEQMRADVEDLTYYCCEVHPRNVIDDVLEIINKHKAESEVSE